MRKAVMTRAIVVVIAAAVTIGMGAPGAAAVPVNGFAYQDLDPFTEVGDFYERGLDLPYARAIIPFDVADHPTKLAQTIAWVQRMQQRGRDVLISFNYPDAATSSTWPPHQDVYAERVARFRNALSANGATVWEFTAWNEPNLSPSSAPNANPSATLAAKYFKKLHALCQIPVAGRTCTVTAGDFSDPEPLDGSQFTAYVNAYTAELASGTDRVTPTRWAIHPYRALEDDDFNRIESWIDTQTGSAEIWLTEIGAMYCKARIGWVGGPNPRTSGDPTTAAARQNVVAQRLNLALATRSRVRRTYYYSLGGSDRSTQGHGFPHCDVEPQWDSWLIGNQYGYTYGFGGVERPAFRTLFPNAPRAQAPTVSSVAASDVTIDRATIGATVNSTWIGATYQVQYGLTAGYGSVATGTVRPSGAAVAVSERLVGLRPNTTYHFRVVVASATGTAASADQTFTTRPMPQPGGLAVVPSAGTVSLFARAPDGSLQHKRYPEAGNWSAWQGLGGTVASEPAAISVEDGHVDVYARGGDGALHHRWYRPADGWSAWQSLGGQMRGTPAPVSAGPGQLDVYVRGGDDGLHHRWITPAGTWSGWENLGGTIVGDPAPVSWGPGHTEVFARGGDNAIYRRSYDASRGWSAWEGLGGAMASDPVVVSSRPGQLDLFARGADDSLMHRRYDDGRWEPWESLGGTIRGKPTAITWGPGHVEVIADTPIDELCQRRLQGGFWSAWGCLGGTTVAGTPVDAVSLYHGHLDVYAGHANSLVGHAYVLSDTGPWTRFAPLLPDYRP